MAIIRLTKDWYQLRYKKERVLYLWDPMVYIVFAST